MNTTAAEMTVVEQDGDSSWLLISYLSAAVYPPEVLAVMPWRDVQSARSHHRIMVLDPDGSVISTAGLLVREALLDDEPVQIGGVGGVMTSPARQGSGIGRIAMSAVAQLMRRFDEMRFAVLFCETKNIGFYSKLGWQVFHGTVEVQQDSGNIIYKIMTAIVLPVNGVAPRHGSRNVSGLPW